MDLFQDEISEEILMKLSNEWSILEESCLICKYSLLISPDNEKLCVACRITESKNFFSSLDNQYNDLSIQFKKLTTPSKEEVSLYLKSLQEQLNKGDDHYHLDLLFSMNFGQYVSSFMKKGWILTTIKCQVCNYNQFKNEQINDLSCFKCKYNEISHIEENFMIKFKKFTQSMNNAPNSFSHPIDFKSKYFQNLVLKSEPEIKVYLRKFLILKYFQF